MCGINISFLSSKMGHEFGKDLGSFKDRQLTSRHSVLIAGLEFAPKTATIAPTLDRVAIECEGLFDRGRIVDVMDSEKGDHVEIFFE